ncbi:PQQ-dependent sugar dehydrogenase [Amycolatopsis azurea]|uniref:Sporulation protein n=1 Tax=Amycolatopsis azurea DSM 43854 TaxID=1238180 RepID=M2PSA5_9PSEU|nr:PQQ-dependent sugar dehydrogenase [Amycolatopsis azurea]EMD22400.1 Sporulation protein [Amycolatopsis azurea DSM 43854]OOC04204.1 sugar dehydrogenase [Amycolatopsis azurea DSM 43854]
MPSKFRVLCRAVVASLIAPLLVPLTSTPASAAPVLPPGFVLRDQPSGQAPYDLTDFAYLPDGSMLTTGKQGNVAWVSATGQVRNITTLPVRGTSDLGLVGIAIAPDYATSRAVYTARAIDVPGGISLRASRWTVSGTAEPTGLTDEKVLIEGPANTEVHAMTGLVAAPDGTVWISTGDSSGFQEEADPFALNVYDLDKIYGKIFHVTADGAGVPDNPYYAADNPDSVRSKVFASGFRSPFRFSLDDGTGLPVVGDVGWVTWEEIDFVQKGANHGWPCFEGNQPTDGFSVMPQCASAVNTPPMLAIRHGEGVDHGNSITAGIVYNGESYPEEYRGAYFFGDYATQKLWTAEYDTQGRVVRPQETPPKFTGIGGPVKFLAAANGDIVYADLYSGMLRRLSYTTGNKEPVAVATSETDPETRTVSFDGSGSYDFDNDQLTYEWDFGDGEIGTGAKVSHTYAAGLEKFTAKLTVKDGLQSSGTTDIAVAPGNHSPKLTMTDPGDRLFAVGEEVKAGATITDAEDGELPVTWTTLVRHCPENAVCHAHPDRGATGPEFTMPFTDHTDSTLEFTASATDSAGVKVSKTYIAKPKEHRLTLTSNVAAALGITPEGGVASAMVVEGATVEIQAAEVASDGSSTFTGWSTGATGRLTNITMGAADQTITANYDTPIDKRYRDEPALAQRLGAPTAPEAVDGTVRFRTYEGGRLYWSKETGVKQIEGEILKKYLALGGHREFGPPATDELTTPDTIGRYNDFPMWPGKMETSIYFTGSTGAHPVYGRIRLKWKELGAEAGELGYPTTDELPTPDGVGRFNHFSKNSSVYYTVPTDAHAIWGRIRAKWEELGWEAGPLGYPMTDELPTPDGIGRFNHFSKAGSVYWTMQTDAHAIYGGIRQRWEALGWETSYLRYPTTDEFSVDGGRQNNFQGGYVYWNASTWAITDRRW